MIGKSCRNEERRLEMHCDDELVIKRSSTYTKRKIVLKPEKLKNNDEFAKDVMKPNSSSFALRREYHALGD